jgi:putative DNA primase/helicase
MKAQWNEMDAAFGNVESFRAPTAPVRVRLKCGAAIPPENVEWRWKGWLACGKLSLLGGAPGTGKTTIALGLGATITVGGKWPDGSQCDPGNVVIWSGEDEAADTLVPRLVAMGADMRRVFFVESVEDRGESRAFDPAKDVPALEAAIREAGGAAFIIVDPIVSAVAADSHKNGETRRALQPLVDLAANCRAALFGITHFSKGTTGREPLERITGSVAFGALPRVVMIAAKETQPGPDASPRPAPRWV